MPKLLVISGSQKGYTYRLKDKKITIGRDPANTLFIPDSRISRRHAVLRSEDEGYVLEDLGSVNGTLVNDISISKRVLKIGDKIKLGATVLKFLSLLTSDRLEIESSPFQVELLPEEEITQRLTVEKRLLPERIAFYEAKLDKADKGTIHRAYKRLIILYQISHNLNAIIELPPLFDRMLDLIIDVMKADRGVIMLLDQETGEFALQSVRHGRNLQGEAKIGISKTIVNHVIETGQSLLISNAREDERFMNEDSVVFHDIRSAMCIPIKGKGSLLGIIHIDTKGNQIIFDEEDLELLTAISSQAAAAMEKAALFDDLKKAHEELKNRQNQLIQSEKLSAMGRLAGGVAHEINNPLTSILGFADLISAQLSLSTQDQETLNKCIDYLMILKKEAIRCKQITQGLLQLSHPKRGEKNRIDINRVIRDSLEIAQFHLKTCQINIITDLQPDLPALFADKNQLQQVFLNLIINAKDAMTREGTIRIRTHEKAQWVVIKFEDTGCGIPPEDLEKAFLPLYTTKQDGKGSGLGLCISQSIIEDHRGFIEVKSRVGKGTIFVIRFPSAPAG